MDRKIDQIMGRNTSTPVTPQSLGASLLSKRTARQSEPKNATTIKLTAVTTKEKQKFLDKTFTKGHATSSIQLLKMRQMANRGLHNENHFLGDKARGFLHRSAGGVKLQGEELKKFIEAGIQGEIEVTEETLSNPLEYHVRHEGARHLSSKANVLIRKLKKEAEHQAALQQPKPDELAMRRERLDALHARMTTPNQPQASASGIKLNVAPPPMTSGAITPTSSAGGSHKPAISRYLNTQAQTTSGGSSRYSPGALEPTPITPPTGTSAEDGSALPTLLTPTAEPILQDPEPVDDPGEPVPAHPAVPNESAPIGDALGGSGEE